MEFVNFLNLIQTIVNDALVVKKKFSKILLTKNNMFSEPWSCGELYCYKEIFREFSSSL